MSDPTQPHVIEAGEFDIACNGKFVEFDLPISGGNRGQWHLQIENAVAFAEGILGVVAAATGKERAR